MPVQVNSETAGVFGSAPGAENTSITTNGIQVLKAGAGVFYGLLGLTSGNSWTVQIIDSATGAVTGRELWAGPAPQAPSTGPGSGGQASPPFGVGVKFYNGLTIVTSGAVPGSLLVCWK